LNLFTSQSEQAKAKLHQAEVDIKTLAGTISEKKKSLTEIKKEIVQAEKEVEKAEGELKVNSS
jgi:dsDNA-specific endonuclease/ATPase MutS2